MQVFVRVADCGSFSRAAESLDLSNATVTNCVRKLETHLGATLIDRDTRRLRLTEQGRMFADHARALIQAMERAEDEVRAQIGEVQGRLQVETIIALGRELVVPHLPEFARRYPGISVTVTLSNQPQNLIERGVDVALRFGHVEDSDLVARAVAEMHYVVCCTPEMAASLPEDPADLDPRLCLGITREERRALITWELRKDERTVEIQPDGPLHFNTGADVLVAVRAGTGVGCVLDVLAAPDLASGALVQLYPQWATPARTLYLVTPKSRVGTAKIKAFVDFLLERLEGRRPDVTRPVAVRPRGNR